MMTTAMMPQGATLGNIFQFFAGNQNAAVSPKITINSGAIVKKVIFGSRCLLGRMEETAEGKNVQITAKTALRVRLKRNGGVKTGMTAEKTYKKKEYIFDYLTTNTTLPSRPAFKFCLFSPFALGTQERILFK